MTLRYGDHLTLSIWLAGDETPEMLRQFMAEDAKQGLTLRADKERVKIGEPSFEAKLPGADRVPPVPKWLEDKIATIGRKPVVLSLVEGKEPVTYPAPVLLVAEAMVIGQKPSVAKRGFLADLGPEDLKRLRRRTREIWDSSGVGYRTLTDQECDKLIDEHGPDAAAEAVMRVIQPANAVH
ncbi:MAG TPA: hypothetical protein VEA41_03585 [Salinarimonas sp.]|nr:hypothetical protein [Salinarimonas sp.]